MGAVGDEIRGVQQGDGADGTDEHQRQDRRNAEQRLAISASHPMAAPAPGAVLQASPSSVAPMMRRGDAEQPDVSRVLHRKIKCRRLDNHHARLLSPQCQQDYENGNHHQPGIAVLGMPEVDELFQHMGRERNGQELADGSRGVVGALLLSPQPCQSERSRIEFDSPGVDQGNRGGSGKPRPSLAETLQSLAAAFGKRELAGFEQQVCADDG